MAVANNFTNVDGTTRSQVYEWNNSTQRFEVYQEFTTGYTSNWEHFEKDGIHYLAQAASDISRFYRWDGDVDKFKLYRAVPKLYTSDYYVNSGFTETDWAYAKVSGTQHVVIVSNNSSRSNNEPETRTIVYNFE